MHGPRERVGVTPPVRGQEGDRPPKNPVVIGSVHSPTPIHRSTIVVVVEDWDLEKAWVVDQEDEEDQEDDRITTMHYARCVT